jgi:DNA-binding transcriptional ArsR family regulator
LDVPPRVPALLKALQHPVRLPILVALSSGAELSAAELGERIGAPSGAVLYALNQLVEAALVEVVRVEIRAPGNTTTRIYSAQTGDDWPALVAAVDAYAARAEARLKSSAA